MKKALLKNLKQIRFKAIEKVKTDKRNNCGYFCDFYKITETIGLKIYSRKKLRDKCFKYQRYASKYKLAPKVFGKIYINRERSQKRYGYFTEIAEKKRLKDGDSDLLYDLLRKIKMHDDDLHSENVRYIGNRIVLIDFSETSWRGEKEFRNISGLDQYY
jgi:hypothetical protein